MTPSLRRIVGSGLWYAVAFVATTLLHELAHAVAALAFGRSAALFNNRVEHPGEDEAVVSTVAHVVGSAAGPLFSLLQGLLVLLLLRRHVFRHGTTQLFAVWFAFHGLTNFAGYLFSTPFAPGADLGSIAARLGLPVAATIAVSVVGFAALRATGLAIAPHFLGLLPKDVDENDGAARKKFLMEIAIIAWPVGVVLVLPSSLPIPHWLSLVYVMVAGAATTFTTEHSRKRTTPAPRTVEESGLSVSAALSWVAVTTVAIALSQGLVLAGSRR